MVELTPDRPLAQVPFRIDPVLLLALDEQAAKRGVTRMAWLREAVKEKIRRDTGA